MTHFELTFMQGENYGSSFTLLYVEIQFLQMYMLKRVSFFPISSFGDSFLGFLFYLIDYMSSGTMALQYNLRPGIVITSTLVFLVSIALVV